MNYLYTVRVYVEKGMRFGNRDWSANGSGNSVEYQSPSSSERSPFRVDHLTLQWPNKMSRSNQDSHPLLSRTRTPIIASTGPWDLLSWLAFT